MTFVGTLKKNVFLVGFMGVGKTTVCQELKRLTAPSVFLDGDWCWDMEPFQVTAETKAMVQENIAFLLGQFLRCPAYETVIFCWVMHQQEILDGLLARLPLEGVEVFSLSLLAKPETLRERIRGDVERGLRTWDVLDRSLERLSHYGELNTHKLWVDGLTAREAAQQIAAHMRDDGERADRAREQQGPAACQIILRRGVDERTAAAEHPPDPAEGRSGRGREEEHPADEHEQQHACKQFLFHPSSFAAK